MDFDEWFETVKLESNGQLQDDEKEDFRSYFNNGYTPEDAVAEVLS